MGLHCRNIVYDLSLGGCLDALHCNCPEDVVELTAADLVDVFSHSMGRTKSQELKVNNHVSSAVFEKIIYSFDPFMPCGLVTDLRDCFVLGS